MLRTATLHPRHIPLCCPAPETSILQDPCALSLAHCQPLYHSSPCQSVGTSSWEIRSGPGGRGSGHVAPACSQSPRVHMLMGTGRAPSGQPRTKAAERSAGIQRGGTSSGWAAWGRKAAQSPCGGTPPPLVHHGGRGWVQRIGLCSRDRGVRGRGGLWHRGTPHGPSAAAGGSGGMFPSLLPNAGAAGKRVTVWVHRALLLGWGFPLPLCPRQSP